MLDQEDLNDGANDKTFVNVLYQVLISLTKLRPVNTEDYITQEAIPIERAVVFVSTGQQFDLDLLIDYHEARGYKWDPLRETDTCKWLLNPATNLPFSQRDTRHIQEAAFAKGRTIRYLKGMISSVRPFILSSNHEGRHDARGVQETARNLLDILNPQRPHPPLSTIEMPHRQTLVRIDVNGPGLSLFERSPQILRTWVHDFGLYYTNRPEDSSLGARYVSRETRFPFMTPEQIEQERIDHPVMQLDFQRAVRRLDSPVQAALLRNESAVARLVNSAHISLQQLTDLYIRDSTFLEEILNYSTQIVHLIRRTHISLDEYFNFEWRLRSTLGYQSEVIGRLVCEGNVAIDQLPSLLLMGPNFDLLYLYPELLVHPACLGALREGTTTLSLISRMTADELRQATLSGEFPRDIPNFDIS